MFHLIKHRRLAACGVLLTLLLPLVAGCGKSDSSSQIWGQADAKELDLNSKIPGRVVELLVKEGDQVKKGQLLARIDKQDLNAKAAQAQAGVESLQAQQNQAAAVTDLQQKTSQASYDNAKAQLAKAEASLNLARNDYYRYRELVETKAVSQQVFENYKTKYESALANYAQAQAGVSAAAAGLQQVEVNRAMEESIKSRVDQAKAALQEVDVNRNETEIRAPFDGIITAKYVNAGAMISQGMPIVAIQDPTDNWVNIKVKETDLSQYALQQKLRLEGRDNKLHLEGTVVDISRKPEFATYRATSERGDDTDIITFNVKIQVNSSEVRPGMRFRILGEAK